MRHRELPTRRVAKFDDLFAQAHLSGATGRQIDRPDWHLRRKAQGVGGCSATRDDRLSPLTGERLDRLFYGRGASAKPACDREEINAAASPQQLASLGQTRQSLIHRGAIAEVKQAFGRDRRALRQFRRVRKNLFAQALHAHYSCQKYTQFSDTFQVWLPRTWIFAGEDLVRPKRMMNMRDGSLDDVVDAWIGRIVEEHWGRNPGDNEAAVYFALMKAAGLGLLRTHTQFKPGTNYRQELVALVESIGAGLDAPEVGIEAVEPFEVPTLSELQEDPVAPAQIPAGEHANYWETDTWKKDFLTGYSRWFWDMKDYAVSAGRRKSDFLWEVAEVWVATAATALVYYAKDDRQRWFETAQLLRHYADLTEADGLRSLPWGRWARHSPKNRRPKP
jgi:hypothetical protein